MPDFDLAVIGAGPGGFDAALRASALGLKVALIDKSDPGGTCLHSGCIPTKSLLASAKLISRIIEAESLGLSAMKPAWSFASMVQRKNQVVETLKKGMLETLKRSRVEWITGEAKFNGKNRLGVEKDEMEAKTIIIATGSQPAAFPGVPFDGKKILSSTQLLDLKTTPRSLLILGGGVVGVEFASLFQALGVKITIVEMLDQLIATEDEEISRRLESLFKRKAMDIHTGQKVKSLSIHGDSVEALLESGERIEAERVLVCIGRRPQIEGLELEKAGIQVERGKIIVDEHLQTSVPGVFAIGDVTSRSTGLAHGASAEAVRVVDNLKGPQRSMNYDGIPNCIYTDPEVASVGTHFKPALEEIIETKVLFSSLGKAQLEGETEGFLKMTASKVDGRILRVSAIGSHVTELIHEAVLAIKAGITVQALADTVHAHPTESEILQKAAQKLLQKGRSLDNGVQPIIKE